MMKVAFQGEFGAYGEDALRRFFGDAAVPLPCREFADVAAAVEAGREVLGVLPVENTLVGSVAPSWDILASGRFGVVGEVVVAVHHCVLGVPGASLAGLRRVASHPVALAQCTGFFRAHPGVEAVAAYDTGGAAMEVAAAGDAGVGAIAGRGAAARYGLVVLAADVEDRADNQTRFLVVGRPEDAASAGVERADKSLLLVDVENRPGALAGLLLPLAACGANVSRVESRPAGAPWTYRYFVEIEADAADPRVAVALDGLRGGGAAVEVLGRFARASPVA